MSEKLGPLTFGKKDEEIFLGREIATHRDFSEKTAEEIDEEVKRIIHKAEKRVEELLSKNIDKLHRLAEALLEREILDGEEIDLVLEGKPLPEKKETRSYDTLKKRRNSDGKKDGENSGKASEEQTTTPVAEEVVPESTPTIEESDSGEDSATPETDSTKE